MASKKTSDKVEIIENDVTEPDTPKGEIRGDLYVESEVELINGRKIPVEVIVNMKKLPATFGNLMHEGNTPAMVVAQCSTQTRRYLDLFGATLEDLDEVIAPVIERGKDAYEAQAE